jgi:hypothetical protein
MKKVNCSLCLLLKIDEDAIRCSIHSKIKLKARFGKIRFYSTECKLDKILLVDGTTITPEELL